jgi:hypothetical protein
MTMLHFILADEDLLTTLGRIAALVLVIYVFLFAVLFVAVSLILLYANEWFREKVGLLQQVRVILQNVDTAIHAPTSEPLPAALETDNRLGQVLQVMHKVQSVHVVEKAKNTQKQVDKIDKKVEPIADHIADFVIEFRARTVMSQRMLKAFFVPGSIKLEPRSPVLLPEALPTDGSPVYEIAVSSSNVPDVASNVVVTQIHEHI